MSAEDRERYLQDMLWINSNRAELLTQYPEQYILVLNKKVVDHDKNLFAMFERLLLRGLLQDAKTDKYAPAFITANLSLELLTKTLLPMMIPKEFRIATTKGVSKPVNIVVLHWHKKCPKCGKNSCFYIDFHTDEDSTKLPSGFYECDSCHEMIPEETFCGLPEVTMLCPSSQKVVEAKP